MSELCTLGKVFCQYQKTAGYHPSTTAYYVPDKRYGESIINQFTTIVIDRRKKRDRIEQIFGTKPLTNLKLSLFSLPPLHPLNTRFEQELEHFKPYVYVLRQEQDTKNHTERTRIKEIRFKLVQALEVTLKDKEGSSHLSLRPYEYLYLPDKQTIYIYTPDYLDSEERLKGDINLCSTIADAFSALIDVDANRQQIRELFSLSFYNRDEIIRNELDDDKLEKLAAARRKLGIVSDPRLQFWTAFVRCFPAKRLQLKSYNDATLLDALCLMFPELSNYLHEVYRTIHYEYYSEEESARNIVRLFQAAGITIVDFNTYAYPVLDISELYGIEFKRKRDSEQELFRQLLYRQAVAEINHRKEFQSNMLLYQRLKPTYRNEVDFDVAADLQAKVQTQFGIDLREPVDMLDLEAVVMTNKNHLLQIALEKNISEQLTEQYLTENKDADSLLFFEAELQVLLASLIEWVGIDTTSGEEGTTENRKRISFGGQPILYKNYADLKTTLDLLLNRNDIEQFSVGKIQVKKSMLDASDDTMDNHKLPPSGKAPRKPKEDIGFLGEYLVYKYLMQHMDKKECVHWVSQYAKEAGVNSKGIDGLGYDLEYTPNNAQHPRYVEVKVVGKTNAFHISAPEVRVGERLKKYYEVFLVRNISNPAKLSIEIIQGLFVYGAQSSFTDNDRFSVENENFIIRFDKIVPA